MLLLGRSVSPRMEKIPVYILAGGKSSRFGSDKAMALLDGKPLILRLAKSIEPLAASMTVIAESPDKYASLGLRTIADRTPGCGPLAGLESALCDCTHSTWLLLLSCDLIVLNALWIDLLLHHRRDSVRAVAFRPDRWQPMLAVYHRDTLPIVQRRLAERQLRMQDLLDELNTIEAPLPHDWPTVLQANTPTDLSDARASNR